MEKAGLVNHAYATGQVSDIEYTDSSVEFTWFGRQESWPTILQPYVKQAEEK